MTTIQAQQMVANARLRLHQAGAYSADVRNMRAAQQAWKILFAAENLLSDPSNRHYQLVLESRGMWMDAAPEQAISLHHSQPFVYC